MITIRNHRAHLHGAPVAWVPSPNISGRMEPQIIVLHETAGRLDKGNAVSWLCKPSSKVSAHFVIERDGTIVQLVACDRVAFHAGKSEWNGRANCNAFSIGIELVGPGKLSAAGRAWFGEAYAGSVTMASPPHGGSGTWLPFTPAQIAACDALVAGLLAAYPSITNVAGHYEISPGRKVDPAPTLDMAPYRAMCSDRFAPDKKIIERVQERLLALGYDCGEVDGSAGPKLRGRLRDFQEQNDMPITGELDRATYDRLMSDGAVEMTSGTRRDTTLADVETSETKIARHAINADRAYEGWQAYDSLEKAFSKASAARSMGDNASTLMTWATSQAGMRFIVMMIILAVAYWGVRRVDWRRLQARAKGISGQAVAHLQRRGRALRRA